MLHLVVIPRHIHGTLESVGRFKHSGENTFVKQMHVPGWVQLRAINIEGIGEVEEGIAIVGHCSYNGRIVVTL